MQPAELAATPAAAPIAPASSQATAPTVGLAAARSAAPSAASTSTGTSTVAAPAVVPVLVEGGAGESTTRSSATTEVAAPGVNVGAASSAANLSIAQLIWQHEQLTGNQLVSPSQRSVVAASTSAELPVSAAPVKEAVSEGGADPVSAASTEVEVGSVSGAVAEQEAAAEKLPQAEEAAAEPLPHAEEETVGQEAPAAEGTPHPTCSLQPHPFVPFFTLASEAPKEDILYASLYTHALLNVFYKITTRTPRILFQSRWPCPCRIIQSPIQH